jgi:hypothetical protein
MYFHSLSFHTGVDEKFYGRPGIDVLSYDYGNSHQFAARPSDESWSVNAVDGTDNFGSGGLAGMMPRGEYLYVKWRIKATGEIFEEKVDLTKRLPDDMTNYGLHFAIFGTKLYVYLFPPCATQNAPQETVVHDEKDIFVNIEKILLNAPYARQHQIYPEKSK